MKKLHRIMNPHMCYGIIVIAFILGVLGIKYFYDKQINLINEDLEGVGITTSKLKK